MNLIKKILAAQAAVLALWAVGAQAATVDEIVKRVQPAGEVCIQGQECAAAGPAVAAATGGARSGDEIVGKYCNACHGTGLLGAPKVGDTADWKKRADAAGGGVDGLLKYAISGLNAMPPKGTCADCSDDELKAAIVQMSGM